MSQQFNDESGYPSWRESARSYPMEIAKMYNDQFSRVEALFKEVMGKLDGMDKKLQELLEEDYYEEEKPPQRSIPQPVLDRFIDDDEIYTKGQKIPYNRISNPKDMDDFRDFINYILAHENRFTPKEVTNAGYVADKNFIDIRISDNTRRVIGQAYMKHYKKQWSFNFERIFMHKYLGQIAWSFADGTRE